MDYWFGNLVNDYILYKIIEGIIAILSMITIYLGIQITLAWKSLRNKTSDPVVSNKKSFIRSSIFIFIAGFFMLIHEFFEGLEKEAPDYVTYEFFELIALSGLVLFLNEWHNIFKKK